MKQKSVGSHWYDVGNRPRSYPTFFFFLIYECSDRYLERLLRIFKGLTIKLSAHPTKHD